MSKELCHGRRTRDGGGPNSYCVSRVPKVVSDAANDDVELDDDAELTFI